MGEVKISGERFKEYPGQGTLKTRRTKVAGIEGTMVRTEGPCDAIACGPGQAVERMGKVKGKADKKPTMDVFGNATHKTR
jgi:hypothetical protein